MISRLTISAAAVRRGGRLLFQGLDLELAAGQACALTGPNGSGKTSLLRAIAGLIRLEAGEIGFGGLAPAEARAGLIHFAGHADGLKTARTAREELGFWSRWDGADAASTGKAVDAFGLAGLLDLEVRRLSAGQRRRLALARLLAAPRPLWLLDEPLSPLDAAWRATFANLMAAHLAEGGLVLAAMHDPLPGAHFALDLAG